MPRYAAFLRGINLGNRRPKGHELCAPLEDLGLSGLSTFRASGNVVFEAGREPAGKLTRRIEQALEDSLGYDVAVFLRSATEVRAIAAHEPFVAADVESSAGKLQVSVLSKLPPAKGRDVVLKLATSEDRLAFGKRELYWLPSGGMRDSQLDLKAIDRIVGVSTMRTMGTIQTIAEKYFAG